MALQKPCILKFVLPLFLQTINGGSDGRITAVKVTILCHIYVRNPDCQNDVHGTITAVAQLDAIMGKA